MFHHVFTDEHQPFSLYFTLIFLSLAFTLDFLPSHHGNDLTFTLMDEDPISDDTLSSATINLCTSSSRSSDTSANAPLQPNVDNERSIQMKDKKGKDAGKLFVIISFKQ